MIDSRSGIPFLQSSENGSNRGQDYLSRIKCDSIIYEYKLQRNIKVSIKQEIERKQSTAAAALRNLFPLKPDGGNLDFSQPSSPGLVQREIAMKLYAAALSETEYPLINSMTSQDCSSHKSFIFCPLKPPQFHFYFPCTAVFLFRDTKTSPSRELGSTSHVNGRKHACEINSADSRENFSSFSTRIGL